ncbi:hypothetical protein PSTG_13698 [Puccinia striiformis f. sp. tritici PST-78]|uniref:Uncharacterized protein n=1 Tax=Puccinia striiformis f. sp. tritici PST-78 TaxID=1165861 RepID=A0A0L0V0V5_9BASI|nr:hypothetical protein PSTG_13698 [Puccinia striiformis f. sp. tritici PST-78]
MRFRLVSSALRAETHNKPSQAGRPTQQTPTRRPNFAHRVVGTLKKVLRVFNNGQNIELELPEGDKRHPSMHVSKIKPYYSRQEEAALDAPEVSSSQIVAPPSDDPTKFVTNITLATP